MLRLFVLLALSLVLSAPRTALAVISASNNPFGPITVTTHDGSRQTGFTVDEDVSYDPSAGRWHKEFVNVGSGPMMMIDIPSGQTVSIVEIITNDGPYAWTDWHEEVVSMTDVGTGEDYPEFLFLYNSLNVSRNGNFLTPGVHYTLVTDSYPDQVSPEGDWSSISIFFQPGAEIQPGDTLLITKDIFEVFGNGSTWEVGEAAVVAQYPTVVPEPASIGLAGLIGVAGLWSRRRKR